MKQKKTHKKKEKPLGLSRRNFQIFGLGVLVLIIGYIFMTQGPANSFSSLTLAPIILVIGYCILVPIAILHKSAPSDEQK